MHPAFLWLCYSLLWLTFYCITFRLSSFLPSSPHQSIAEEEARQMQSMTNVLRVVEGLFTSTIRKLYPGLSQLKGSVQSSSGKFGDYKSNAAVQISQVTLTHWYRPNSRKQRRLLVLERDWLLMFFIIPCASHLAQFSFRCCNDLVETCSIVCLVPRLSWGYAHAWDPGTRPYNNPYLVIYFVKIILF